MAGVISIFINMITSSHPEIAWMEGAAIEFAVLLSSGVQAVNNYQKEKQFRELNQEAEKSKRVAIKRGNVVTPSPLDDVVVGDLVQIRSGMEIAGDGICLSSYGVLTDEAAMTGETEKMAKEPISTCLQIKDKLDKEGKALSADIHAVPSPVMLAGTKVSKGEGWMVIINVGRNSAIGKIQDILSSEEEMTPLQRKLEKLAGDLGKFGMVMALLTVLILVIRWIVDIVNNGWSSEHMSFLLSYIIIGITVLVVSIPEGLPLAVTLSLAFSMKKMMKDANLVRKLHACETMGGANVICSDKTGTLTKNQMTIYKFWNREEFDTYEIHKGQFISYKKFFPKELVETFEELGALCSVDSLKLNGGSATEIAVLKYLEADGIDADLMRSKFKFDHKELFSSDRKRMSVVVETSLSKTGRRMYMKGASEYMLDACSLLYDFKESGVVEMTEELKGQVSSAIQSMAKQTLRTIGICYKDVEENADFTTKGANDVLVEESSGFIMIGVLGLKDPLRAGVKEAVEKCHRAGVDVKMVTGDNKVTARAISIECGILSDDGDRRGSQEDLRVLEGSEFLAKVGGIVCKNHFNNPTECDCVRNSEEQKKPENKGKKIREDTIQNPAEFDKIWKDLKVMARSRPEDKYCLVVGIKERKNVVAVTGDGTNDAPALSKADVGFAMGIAGTEVAKQAASIILTDDNFASITRAIIWGRNVYDAIRKFLQFQLTVNVVAVTSTLISSAILTEPLLSAVQLLWVNLIMDTLASLALTTEPPEEKLLDRLPHKRTEYIISKEMFKHLMVQSLYQMTVLLLAVFVGEHWIYEPDVEQANTKHMIISGRVLDGYDEDEEGPSRMFTFIFNVFVVMTIFDFVSARKLHGELNIFAGISKSKYFIIIMLIISCFQIIICTFGSRAFRCKLWVFLLPSTPRETLNGIEYNRACTSSNGPIAFSLAF